MPETLFDFAEEANPSRRDKLLAAGGIYLLTDRARARLYVGQAGGKTGFWGRRKAYAELRTGNVAIDPAFNAGELRPTTPVPSGCPRKRGLVTHDRPQRWCDNLAFRS